MANLHRCARCDCRERLTRALTSDGEPSPTAQAIIDALAAGSSPSTLRWLTTKPDTVSALRSIADGDQKLTHARLDELVAADRHGEYLRHRFIAAGLLPRVDHHLALFDRWSARFLATIGNDTDRTTLTAYVAWHHRRRLARSLELGTLRPWSTRVARQQIRIAASFLDWLWTSDTLLSECSQANIDLWFSTGPATRSHTVNFLTWARQNRHCPRELRFPNYKPATPRGMSHEDRAALIATLLHDTTLDLADRVAGLLVALHAQPASRLIGIRLSDVDVTEHAVNLHVGTTCLELDPDTAALLTELVAQRRENSLWLCPGKLPGQPTAPNTLAERLRHIGVNHHARVAAFHDLATQVPSTILAQLIGYNPNFLAERAAILGAPWHTYASIRARPPRATGGSVARRRGSATT